MRGDGARQKYQPAQHESKRQSVATYKSPLRSLRAKMARVMLRSRCNRGESGRVYSGSPRRCGEIVFGFATVGLNEEAILHARFERVSGDAFEGGVHAWDRRSVRKFLCRNGIGIRNQMPNCMRIFI